MKLKLSLVLALLVAAGILAAPTHLAAQSSARHALSIDGDDLPLAARSRTPMKLGDGQSLRVQVRAAAGDRQDDLRVSIRILSATGRPVAQLPATRLTPGRSVDLEFEHDGRDETMLLVAHVAVEGGDDGRSTLDAVATAQVFERTGQNQLWGDWFII